LGYLTLQVLVALAQVLPCPLAAIGEPADY